MGLAITEYLMASLIVSLLVLLSSRIASVSTLDEADRIREYHKRSYTWPPTKYVPSTDGWRQLMDERVQQLPRVVGRRNRYCAYVQTIHQALLAPNFTESGFGLSRCPDSLITDLQRGIRDGLSTAGYEKALDGIDGPDPPLFIERPDLTQRVLTELQPYAEAWSGLDLVPSGAYGFRLYQNDSRLFMHLDNKQTHIISLILHIDSSDDAEPWPIFIEDFDGRTHQVVLTPGDILFYESSKCAHGRPTRFRGSWYTSVFSHYYPKTGWHEVDHQLEAQYAVPPEWSEEPAASEEPVSERYPTQLAMRGTGMREPDCPDEWCRTADSIRWSGPGQDGFLITPKKERIPFHPRPYTTGEEL